jgi:MerR family transcriptional regulator, copper efflux regulator
MRYPMNIGEAADAAGVTAKMIRHYEQLGLIAEATRTEAGYRQYTSNDVAVLRFIRQSRSMGFSIKQIGELIDLWADSGRQSRDVKALASRHIADLDRKMSEMAQMKAALETLTLACHGDQRPDCPIIGTLSGNAAAAHAGACCKPAAKARATTKPAAKTPKAQDADHAGLSAWMRGLGRTDVAEHAA